MLCRPATAMARARLARDWPTIESNSESVSFFVVFLLDAWGANGVS